MVAFLRLFKKRFGGLKNFILAHPDHFDCGGEEHNFNPMVSVIHQPTMSAMFQGDGDEVEEEEYGYGGAVSKSGLLRPRQQGYRDDAGYNPAPGLGPQPFQYFDEGVDLLRSSTSSFLPAQYEAVAPNSSFFAHEQLGPVPSSFKYHQEEGDPRHAIGYKEFDVKQLSDSSPRYGQQRQPLLSQQQQQQQPYGQDRNVYPSQRRYQPQQQQQQLYDQDRDSRSPRGYPQQLQQQQQQSYDRDRDASRRYQQPPPPTPQSHQSRPMRSQAAHQQQPRQW